MILCNQDISKTLTFMSFKIGQVKSCYQDISKTNTASSFNLGQLIKDND